MQGFDEESEVDLAYSISGLARLRVDGKVTTRSGKSTTWATFLAPGATKAARRA